MSQEAEILEKLKRIIDPDLGKDIVTLGFIKDLKIDGSTVAFNCELTTPACPVKDMFKTQCEEAVSELDWVEEVTVTITAQPRKQKSDQVNGLTGVKQIIAVGSCKGGVGKSTVTTNLAFTLQRQGARVGIFDADIFGPSLSTMVKTEDDYLTPQNNMLLPNLHESGMKLMSFAYANPNKGPAIMRGPMVTQVLNQLLTTTAWGELDYLLIDMPPGTGDIQLTLAQIIPLTASVMVTTPQEISFIDVEKGIQMFDKMKVPVLAVVENMSYFICDGCDKKHYIFGQGARRKLVEQYGIINSYEIPMDPSIAAHSDEGDPIAWKEPDSDIAAIYNQISEQLVREVSKIVHGDEEKPVVTFQAGEGIHFTRDGKSDTINAAVPRRNCRCAQCVSEFTGEKVLKDEDVPEDIEALEIAKTGNYAVTIQWSDGHHSIFPYTALEERVDAAATAG